MKSARALPVSIAVLLSLAACSSGSRFRHPGGHHLDSRGLILGHRGGRWSRSAHSRPRRVRKEPPRR